MDKQNAANADGTVDYHISDDEQEEGVVEWEEQGGDKNNDNMNIPKKTNTDESKSGAANRIPAPTSRPRRKCPVADCPNRVVQGGLCISHGAKRKTCSHPGCTKNVKKAGKCSAHGPARKRCEAEGCTNIAVKGGRCIAHGAKKKVCSIELCIKQAILGGMCKKHHDKTQVGQAMEEESGIAKKVELTVIRTPNNKVEPTNEVPATAVGDKSSINTKSTSDSQSMVADNDNFGKQPLVMPEDRPTIAEFLFLVMEQLRPCRFTDGDRNKRRSENVGSIGVECKHCAGKIHCRKFFWSSVSAIESNFFSVHSHALSCKYVPEPVKVELTRLKALRKEQTSRLKTGSQKAFFKRVWARLHGTPVPA